MKYKANFWECIAVAAFFVACWAWLFIIAPYQIGFKEQASVFIMKPEFLAEYLSKPAFAAVFIGEFLTQFFCMRAIGLTIAILCMVLVWYGMVKVLGRLGLKSGKLTLALLPVVVEMAFVVHLNYPLSATVGLAMAVWSAFGCMCIGSDRLRLTVFLLAMPVTYILAGGQAVLLAIVCIVQNYKKILPACLTVLLGLTAVWLTGRLYNLSPAGALVYPVILGYRLPATWTLSLSPVSVLAACVMARLKVRAWISSIIVSLTWLASLYSTYDERTEFDVEISTKAYRKQWNEVWKMAENAPDGYFLGTFYRNLCLARRGQLPQHLLEYHQYPDAGMSIRVEPGMNLMVAFSSIDQLLEVGDISQATGCALLGQTAMPNGNSSHLLRRLTELAMVSGEYNVAGKYLDLLSATLFHRKWALEMKECLATGRLTEELRHYRSITSQTDRLYYQNDAIGAGRSILAGNPRGQSAVDYLLCSYLLGKNVNSFCSAFEHYYMRRFVPADDVPELYQEALLVNVNSEESFRSTVARYGITEKVASRFIDFMEAQTRASGDISKLEDFKGTYWYYLISKKLSK